MTKYMIIANPISGRGMGERHIPDIEWAFRKFKLDSSLVRTEYPGHAIKLAQQAVADGYNYVIASGGDGTVNEVINGLMLAKKAGLGQASMGVITVGRGNDFAFGAATINTFTSAVQRVYYVAEATNGLAVIQFGDGVIGLRNRNM